MQPTLQTLRPGAGAVAPPAAPHRRGSLAGLAWMVNLGLWLTCLALLASHRQSLLDDAGRESVTVARLVELNVVAVLDRAVIAVGNTVGQLEHQLAAGEIDRSQLWWTVDSQLAQAPQLQRIGVFDAQGRQICGHGSGRCLNLQVADRPYFQHHQRSSGNAIAVHDLDHNRIDQQPVLVLSRALRRPDGGFAGVVIAMLPLQRLQALLAGIDLGPRGAASVRAADLGVLARQPPMPPLTDNAGLHAVSADLQAAMATGERGGRLDTRASSDGVLRVTAWRRLSDYPLLVVVGIGTDDALAGWRHLAAGTVALLLLVGAASAIGVRQAGTALRRQAQIQALAHAQGLMLDTDLVGIARLQGPQLTWANQGMARIFGHPVRTWSGMPLRRLFHDDAGWQQACDAAAQALRGGGTYRAQLPLRHHDGSPLWIDTSAVRMADDTGQLLLLMADITPLKRAEALRLQGALLEAQNAQLVADQRFRRAVLANLSHELRTPLHAVIGFADLLRRSQAPLDSARAQTWLNRIQDSGQRLLVLVEHMLELVRLECGRLELHPQPLDAAALSSLLRDLLDLYHDRADAHQVALAAMVGDGPGDLVVDAQRLRQLLGCLLDNAVKFSRPGGQVRLLATGDGPRHWRLEVHDDGIGMAADDLPRLFQSFEPLDASSTRRHGGAGLGLALAQRLAQAMGGSLGVHSSPGVGSVFHLRLPRRPAAAEAAA